MWRVTCEYRDLYVLKKNSKQQYYTTKDKIPKYIQKQLSTEYLSLGKKIYLLDKEGNRIIKNSNKLNKAEYFKLNGQKLYNGTLHPLVRKSITNLYHEYFKTAIINAGLTKLELPEGKSFKIAVNIYVVESSKLPDVDNLWPLEKWFTDSLVELGIIEDDSPKFVRSNGEKTYVWLNEGETNYLEFIITTI